MKKWFFVLSFISSLAYADQAGSYQAWSDPSSSYQVGSSQDTYPGLSGGYTKHEIPLDQEMTVDRFVKKIHDDGLFSLEQAISALPPEMIDLNYILMYRSGSLQMATPKGPRVISFSPSARFIATFNSGSPDHYGYDTIEMIQFDDQTLRFNFYELLFEEGKAPHLSKPNPAKCMGCHQSFNRAEIDYRPNWEPYNAWPGAFGSFSLTDNQVRLFMTDPYFMAKTLPEDLELVREQAGEAKYIEDYKRLAPGHARYGQLESLSLKAPTRFNQSLGELNFLRVSRLILRERDTFQAYKYLIWHYFTCHPTGHELLTTQLRWNYEKLIATGSDYEPPLKLKTAHQQCLAERGGEALNENAAEALTASEGDESETLSKNSCDALLFNPPLSEPMTTGRFLGLVFEAHNVDTSDWSMDFGTLGRFGVAGDRFTMPGKSANAFLEALRFVLNRQQPEVLQELQSLSCSELKLKSEQALSMFPPRL